MANEDQCNQLIFLLDNLKRELKKATLWSEVIPSPSALESTAPFCCDTLAIEQWLQFVFIERLMALVCNKQTLPRNIAVTPMVAEVLKCAHQFKVIDVVAEIDELLSGQLVQRPWQSKINMTEKVAVS
jgi:dTDP-4-dehydrorhamnose 3,5-epimerase